MFKEGHVSNAIHIMLTLLTQLVQVNLDGGIAHIFVFVT